MKKFLLLILLLQIGVVSCLKAQIDPHFSQIYADPLWLNPALTGVYDGDARLTANFRDQWTGISNGYTTGAFSAEEKVTDKVSVGFNFIDEDAGSANFNYFAGYGTLGYTVPISSDATKKLHFGLQVGLINRSFNPGDLQFENQYNPLIGYDSNIASGETFSSTTSIIFDSGLGIYYDENSSGNSVQPFGGASIFHINGAADPFAEAGTKTVLPIRFNIHGGVKIAASETLDITPSIIYVRQQQNQIRALDINAAFKTTDDNSFVVGAEYRYQDAVVAELGYRLNSLMLGLSYDVNTSALRTATNGNGGIEVSLNYIFGSSSGGASNSSPKF
jgi:type IX secretion system PorP/SprF family membrane protein